MVENDNTFALKINNFPISSNVTFVVNHFHFQTIIILLYKKSPIGYNNNLKYVFLIVF